MDIQDAQLQLHYSPVNQRGWTIGQSKNVHTSGWYPMGSGLDSTDNANGKASLCTLTMLNEGLEGGGSTAYNLSRAPFWLNPSLTGRYIKHNWWDTWKYQSKELCCQQVLKVALHMADIGNIWSLVSRSDFHCARGCHPWEGQTGNITKQGNSEEQWNVWSDKETEHRLKYTDR